MKTFVRILVLLNLLGLHSLSAEQINLADLQAKVAKDDPRAEYDLGRAYQLGNEGVPKDFAKAAELYRKAAALGDAKAMFNLGYMYHFGQGMPVDDATAEQWFQKAADKGLPAAQLQVGLSFYYGENGLKQDYNTAAKYLLMAAQPSNPPAVSSPAANALAYLFENGTGVAQNSQQAIFWYTQAAGAGFGKAMGNLGRVYAEGKIVPKDPVQAYMWLKMAAFQNDQMAMHLLSEALAGHVFTDEQIADGNRMVADYRSKHHQAPLVGAAPGVVTPGMAELAKAKAEAAKSGTAGTGSTPTAAATNAPTGNASAPVGNTVGH